MYYTYSGRFSGFFEFRFMQSPPLSYSILLYPQCYIRWYSLVVHSTTFFSQFQGCLIRFHKLFRIKNISK